MRYICIYYIFVNIGSNLSFIHVSLKERWMTVEETYFPSDFFYISKFQFRSEEIRRITNDIQRQSFYFAV